MATQVDQPIITPELRGIRVLPSTNVAQSARLNVSMTAAAENNNDIVVTIQVREWENSLAKVVPLTVWTSATALGAPADIGDMTQATTGTILVEHTADCLQEVLTDATGKVTVTVTDSGTETKYINCKLPTGDLTSLALTFA